MEHLQADSFDVRPAASPEDILLLRLDRQTELLAQIAEELAPKRYSPSQLSNGGAGGGANTQATIVFPNVPGGANKIWLVEKILAITLGAAVTSCLVFAGEGIAGTPPNGGYPVLPTLLLADGDETANKLIQVFDRVNPIPVKGNETLAVQWQGLTAAAVVFARIWYRIAWQAQD